jgi:hypothetical protein
MVGCWHTPLRRSSLCFASVGLLDSNEAWVTLFHKKRTNADVTTSSHLRGRLLYSSTVLLSSVPPPLSTPIGCLDLCSALQIATPTTASTLPDWYRRCLNPLSLPPSRPGRHRRVPAVPPAVFALLQLSTYSRLLPSIWLRQSILDDADKM